MSDGSDVRLVGHCRGKSHGPRFYRLWQMFASVGKKESVWESMHSKISKLHRQISTGPFHAEWTNGPLRLYTGIVQAVQCTA